MKNILILSDYLPMDGWGGGVIIRSLTKNHPKTLNLFWTMPISRNDKVTCNNIKILKFHTNHFRGRGILKIILLIETYIFIYNFKKLLKNNHIDLVWIVLGTSYDKLFRIEKLMKRVKIPFHISVHDDPIEEIKKNKKSKATILFQNILEKAASIDVISVRMQEQYKKQYGINSIVVTRCISDDFPQNNKILKDKINILMGGYGNASMPWPNPLPPWGRWPRRRRHRR